MADFRRWGHRPHRQLPTSLRKESRDVEEIGEFRTGVSEDRVEVRREHREIGVDHPEVSREQPLTTTQITSFVGCDERLVSIEYPLVSLGQLVVNAGQFCLVSQGQGGLDRLLVSEDRRL